MINVKNVKKQINKLEDELYFLYKYNCAECDSYNIISYDPCEDCCINIEHDKIKSHIKILESEIKEEE